MSTTKKAVCVIALTVACIVCVMCIASPSLAADDGVLTPEQIEAWRADLANLSEQLPALHYDAFHKISEQEFNEAVAKLDADLPGLKQHEVIVRLAQLVALIGDGHTMLNLQQVECGMFPMVLWWFADGPYVIQITSDHKELLGKRVVAINDVPVDEAARKLGTTFSWANESQLVSTIPMMLLQSDTLAALNLAQSPQTTSLTVADGQGSAITQDISIGQPGEQLNWMMDGPGIPGLTIPGGDNYSYTWNQDTGVLLLSYNMCIEREDLPFAEFEKEFLDALDNHAWQRVVIDLRLNGGGDSSILDPLIDKLAAMPAVNQPGKLYVLVGRNTYSSAVLNAMSLRDKTAAILIGEPSGGEPNHFGEVKTFALPNSGLVVQYSTKYFETTDGDPDAIYPDIEASQSYADYLDGYDPALALAADGVFPADMQPLES